MGYAELGVDEIVIGGVMADDPIVQAAKKAINNVFSDTSVSQEETMDRLKELREECQDLIDTVQADIGKKG